MIVFSRRMSWMLLSFSFFLVLAPVLFSPTISAQAQESIGNELKNIIPTIIQWGVGGAMFIVWLYQFRKGQTSDAAMVTLFTNHLAESNKITTAAFAKYDKHVETLVHLLEESQKQTSALTGTLARLEAKLSRGDQ